METSDRPVAEIARELGVPRNRLYKCRNLDTQPADGKRMNETRQPWPASLWKSTATRLDHSGYLAGDIETDLLIIGAGYTGLSCALHATAGRERVVVIDGGEPGWGCSGRNGGQFKPQWKTALAQLRGQ